MVYPWRYFFMVFAYLTFIRGAGNNSAPLPKCCVATKGVTYVFIITHKKGIVIPKEPFPQSHRRVGMATVGIQNIFVSVQRTVSFFVFQFVGFAGVSI